MEANHTDSQRECWLCPLLSLSLAPDIIGLSHRPESIELAEAIQIKRVPSEFTDYLLENHPDWIDVISAEYMVVLPRSVTGSAGTKGALSQTFEASNLLFDIVTAFRLCHRGVVSTGPLLPGTISDTKFYMFKRDFLLPTFIDFLPDISEIEIDHASFGLPEYELSFSDIPIVNKSLKEILRYRKASQLTALDESLRRFNSAYRGEFTDRLIDQMIAFESLYIADHGELTYKLALRTAFFLGKNRTKIFNDLKKAYELRSRIVHGNEPVDDLRLEETIPKTEEYLRQSLRKFLSLSTKYSISEIRKLLDDNILKNGKTLAIKE
jgi:hypothetical protein